jgi:hypothetical protein
VSPTENIDGVGVGGEKIFFPESALESESKKSTPQGTTAHPGQHMRPLDFRAKISEWIGNSSRHAMEYVKCYIIK